ncbi:MAG: 16S rRNA methyltransferase [Promethearchaeota archaeon]
MLVECGLELIPKKIRNHPSIKKGLKINNYASQLLDTALHHSVMKTLKDFEKRGRPDILHACLLNALGSPLNKSGFLTTYIHTINGKIFKIAPKLRITRNYNRFKGLMAKLLIDGRIGIEGTELISPFVGSLEELIQSHKNKQLAIFSSKGKKITPSDKFFTLTSDKETITIIGGFQKNTFSSQLLKLTNNILSLSSFSLDAWIAISRLLSYFEIASGVY